MKKFIYTALAFLLCTPFVFGAGQKEVEEPYLFGLSTKIVSNTWEAFFEKSFQWYCEDNGYQSIINEAKGDPALQLEQSRQMINRGVDGLIVCAQDSNAAKPIVDWATEENIPVFTTDCDINHQDVKMYVGYSGYRAGQLLGKKLVEYLRDEVEPIGEVEGIILEMRGPLGGASPTERSEGFRDALKDYPEVKILQALGEYQEAPAKKEAEAILRRNPHIDAIYSGNGPMCVGGVEAMKDLGMDPTEIFVATIDANPEVLDRIKTDEIDIAVDQPCPFYNPIAVYYMNKYLEEGDAALPKVGDVITAEDFSLSTGVEHVGTDIWASDEAWAPATITEREGHLWLQTNSIVVTKENADAGYLWANVDMPGW